MVLKVVELMDTNENAWGDIVEYGTSMDIDDPMDWDDDDDDDDDMDWEDWDDEMDINDPMDWDDDDEMDWESIS